MSMNYERIHAALMIVFCTERIMKVWRDVRFVKWIGIRKNKNKFPAKVLWYFLVILRFKRMFRNSELRRVWCGIQTSEFLKICFVWAVAVIRGDEGWDSYMLKLLTCLSEDFDLGKELVLDTSGGVFFPGNSFSLAIYLCFLFVQPLLQVVQYLKQSPLCKQSGLMLVGSSVESGCQRRGLHVDLLKNYVRIWGMEDPCLHRRSSCPLRQ